MKCRCLLHLWLEEIWYTLGVFGMTAAAILGLVNLP